MKIKTPLTVLSTALTTVPAPVPDPQSERDFNPWISNFVGNIEHWPNTIPTTEFCCVRISPVLADELYKTAPLCENVDCSYKHEIEPINIPDIVIVIPPSLQIQLGMVAILRRTVFLFSVALYSLFTCNFKSSITYRKLF